MPERASLVTPEAVEAVRVALQKRHWSCPKETAPTIATALQAAEPHLLNAFKERLLSDEAVGLAIREIDWNFKAGAHDEADQRFEMVEALQAAFSTLGASDGE